MDASEYSLVMAGSVAVGIAVTWAAVASIIPADQLQNELYDNLDIHWVADETKSPPDPLFNIMDNEKCSETITQYYVWANQAYLIKKVNDSRLENSFQAILDVQKRYKIELVDNDAFLAWTVSDWGETWEARSNPSAEKPNPENDWSMRQKFISSPNGRGKSYLRTIQHMEEAIQAVYWFRVQYGLEDSIYHNPYYVEPYYNYAEDAAPEQPMMVEETAETDEPALSTLARIKLNAEEDSAEVATEVNKEDWNEGVKYEDYETCSQNTQMLVPIYQQYMQSVTWDNRTQELYPLLDRVEAWIHDEYGKDAGVEAEEVVLEPQNQ